MPNQSGKIVLVLVLLFLLIGVAAYFVPPSFKNQEYQESAPILPIQNPKGTSNPSVLTKDYYSQALKISFKVSDDMQVEESFININIASPNGKIFITRNGSNYEEAKGYYGFLKEKDNLTPIEYREGSTGKYDYVSVIDEDPNDRLKNQKSYIIYADYAVYIFSTSDESLYSVLDQIAQSFEYKP